MSWLKNAFIKSEEEMEKEKLRKKQEKHNKPKTKKSGEGLIQLFKSATEHGAALNRRTEASWSNFGDDDGFTDPFTSPRKRKKTKKRKGTGRKPKKKEVYYY